MEHEEMSPFERKMQRLLSPAVEVIINFFAWTPMWLLKLVGFPCWASAVVTLLVFGPRQLSTTQFLIFGVGAALVGTVCGMALLIKQQADGHQRIAHNEPE